MVLAAGTQAPDFSLISHEGEEVTLVEALQDGPVALVFFPLAFSGICTNELCELRDNISLFTDHRVQLFAVSVDSKFTLAAWAQQEQYDFTLLADFWPHGGVAQQYEVFNAERGFANRATVIIDTDRNIVASFEHPSSQARDLTEYREALAQLDR